MFRTAEAAGWTREARYKTSFYSMLERVGQTLSREGFRRVFASVGQPRSGEQDVPQGVSRGGRGVSRRKPRRGEPVHQFQRYFSSTVIPFFFKNTRNSPLKRRRLVMLLLWAM